MNAIALLLLLADVCGQGVEALRSGAFEKAEPLLSKCAESPDAPAQAFLMLAAVYQALNKPDRLHAVAREGVKRFPDEKRFYLTAGTYAARQKDYSDAVHVLGAASKRWPEDGKVRTLLASAFAARGMEALDRGEPAAATSDLKEAVRLAPEDVESLVNLGRAQHNLLRYSDARQTFDAAMRLQPAFPLLRFHRGMSYYALGEADKALEDLNAQITQDATYAPAFLLRGLSNLALGEDEAAEADLKIAAERMQDSAPAQAAYGRALLRVGKLQDAEARLRAGIKLDPQDPGPVNTLVMVLSRLGKAEEARKSAARAAELAQQRR